MPDYIIPNLRNACRLLRAVSESKSGATIASLSKDLSIPKTTTLRIVTTLTTEGFLRKDDRQFSLGPALISLNSQSSLIEHIRHIAKPLLAELTSATEETSHLAIWDTDRPLISEVCLCPHPLSAASKVGTRAHAHCSATGKILLAHNFADQLDTIWPAEERIQRTKRTLTTLQDLSQDLERIRKTGYALDDEEYFDGVRCIAVPIYDASGSVCAAIGITASANRFTRKRIPEFAEKLKYITAQASKKLGHT